MGRAPARADVGAVGRDPLLDLWRGLALVDMAWVHLATYSIGMVATLSVWIGEYTRFAAGTFVLVAGMSVARAFGAKLGGHPDARRRAYRWLLRRALMLVAADRAIAVAFALVAHELITDPGSPPQFPDPVRLLFFGEPGATGGLLLLYAILLAATPLIDRFQRRFGASLTLATSLSLYAIALLGGAVHPAEGPAWPFPFAVWQPLFVAGYLASSRLGALRGTDGRLSSPWLGAISALFAVVFLLRNGASLGLPPPFEAIAGAFRKDPLSPGELAWYLAVSAFVLSWSARIWEASARARLALGWLCGLGRVSLLIYASHLFLQLITLQLLMRLELSPWARVLALPWTVLLLIGVAAANRRLAAGLSGGVRGEPSIAASAAGARRPLPSTGIVGTLVAAGALMAVIALRPPAVQPWVNPAAAPLSETTAPEEQRGQGKEGLATTEDGSGEGDALPGTQPMPDRAAPEMPEPAEQLGPESDSRT